jgi:hypothetical protein
MKKYSKYIEKPEKEVPKMDYAFYAEFYGNRILKTLDESMSKRRIKNG